jgi:hypothetical protein
MITRVVVAAVAAAALLASILPGPGVQAQTIQPSSGSPIAGPSGYPPQPVTRGGVPAPYPMGPTTQRLPGQNCHGFGQCAWGGQSEQTASCSTDARVCTSQGAGPEWPSMTCTTTGTLRTCTSNSVTSIMPYSPLGTNGTNSTVPLGITPIPNTLPNGYPSTANSGPSNNTIPTGPCIGC